MKSILFLTIAIVGIASCDKSSPAGEKKLAELERQNREAVEQKQQLERQLADQQIASERDAIERERSRMDDERAALEQAQGAEAAAKQEALAAREEALAKREGTLEGLESSFQDRQQYVDQRESALSGRELEAAGREAIPEVEPAAAPAEGQPVADYSTFYDSLAAYGSWLETPAYGYVWQPAAVRSVGWRPYLDGRWVCTNHGWTWLSSEPFGWACYHYGRWALLHGRGWIWVPGDQWAPAWVCWRGSDTHIGWAPLPPETLGWRDCAWDGSVETRFGIASGWFNFVEINHFSSPLRRHCLPLGLNDVCWQQTSNITNIRSHGRNVFVGGPSYQDISRSLGRPVPYYQLNLNRGLRPGHDPLAMRPQLSGHQLNISAPTIHADWNAALRPSRVRGQLENAAIQRPTPLVPDVADHLRQTREQDRLQAERALTQLGGRQAFNQRRTQVLETNQREAAAFDAQRQRAAEDARQHQAAAANQQKTAQADAQRQQVAEDARQRQAAAANQQKTAQADAQRQQVAEDARQRQAAAANQQKTAQADAQRQQAAEDARQRQAAAANQQKTAQADAQRQQVVEDARQRQAAAIASQQRTAQADAQRQRAAEEARQLQQEQLQRQQAQLHQRQAEEAAQQRAQQADGQRQRAAEEAHQRQQDEKKKLDEESRQRQKSGR